MGDKSYTTSYKWGEFDPGDFDQATNPSAGLKMPQMSLSLNYTILIFLLIFKFYTHGHERTNPSTLYRYLTPKFQLEFPKEYFK